jgi:hypothetical protein
MLTYADARLLRSLTPQQQYTATRAGRYVQVVQAFRSGGLLAQYYAGLLFGGRSLLTRVDAQVLSLLAVLVQKYKY